MKSGWFDRRPIWGGVISILIYCNGLIFLLLLSPSLSPPLLLFFLGDVTSSEAVKLSWFLCCPSTVAAAHKQAVIIFCQGRDQRGEQSAHKTTLWQSDWFVKNTGRTHARAGRRAHMKSQVDKHIFTDTCAHTQKQIADEHRNKPNLSFGLSCHAVIIPREKLVCLLMPQTLSVFWQSWNSCLHGIHVITCCCAFY